MHETTPDQQFAPLLEATHDEELKKQLGLVNQSLLVQVGLLMRIYDVQMALLSSVWKEKADEIWDAHQNGQHYNPNIFVPQVKDDE